MIRIVIVVTCCLISLVGCDEGSSSSSNSENSGPLAGIWMGTANGVMHTIRISGPGNQYAVTWETSNNCFNSEAGTAIHIDEYVEILCNGYDAGRDRFTYPNIYARYDGGNALVDGPLHAPTCMADNGTIVLTR